MFMLRITWVIWFYFSAFLQSTKSFELTLGGCPLVFLESCRSNWIEFIFSSYRFGNTYLQKLDPFNPILPFHFNPLKPFKIVIHGYGGLNIDSATRNVTSAYQDAGYNVVIVNWGSLASVPCYATAYLNTWHVGQCVALLAVSLIPLGISPSLIHVIGFSLGAHIAGFAGAHITRTVGIPLRRITGLDPALPFFATLKYDFKLDQTDAAFVDVIHTSAGSFGKIELSGHADFYVNGGNLQPFCFNTKYPPLCSHITAGLYFAESIRNSTHFIGKSCDSVSNVVIGACGRETEALMGEFIDLRTRGIFHVITSDTIPFGLD